ncbi:MAG: hypothetical protein EA341_15085 [Mongoliibacter sp.]|uniref:hypothetical protein n=1 Tax=Mongoliibacter sp. TaxID=2022438 RepID=UPI0012EEF1F4|nr:hypothetical protein [Mongoliibacter sp.]TVP45573.1 MAG: hypothetical protein EA341_15085 [Mongoliibacter sp.]
MKQSFYTLLLICGLFFAHQFQTNAQGLYNARGYWEESNKPTYREIRIKQNTGDLLTAEELEYLNDHEVYLNRYFERMSDSEKDRYYQMKDEWDRELSNIKSRESNQGEFEWRGRDRFVSIAYGFSYGLAAVSIFEIDNVGAVGVPLVMGGLWALGPVFNPKKFEDITRPVLRANNSGRLLGWIYGGSLGLLIAGNSNSGSQVFAGLGAGGSIALGEWAFQKQKRENYSEGHIETLRHYGILGSWVGASGLGAFQVVNTNAYGAGILAGGVLGLAIGNQQSKKYPYTIGDAENTTVLGLIGTGLGFAIAAESLSNSESSAIILVPAVGSVLGTVFGHKSARGVFLTKKQGSTIGYSTAGAALLGLGLMAIVEAESGAAIIGVPSALALITQQILFQNFKKENQSQTFAQELKSKTGLDFSVDINPENYFVNQRMPLISATQGLNINPSQPIVNLSLRF